MTKADVVDVICERFGASKKEAGQVVETVFAIIRECLCRDEKVKISGFGTFATNHKKARRGRDPQTGRAIIIASRCTPAFKPSQVLRALVAHGGGRKL
jgi:integration host factor subunit alpha